MHIKLNDSLDNVITLELTNICIPYTFYNIDSNNGNNYFYIQEGNDTDTLQKIEISSGYYSPSELISAVNTAVAVVDLSFTLSTETNRVTIENNSGTNYLLIFYDYLDNTQSFEISVNEYSPDTQSKINNNLGWFMGFRNINKDNVCLEYTVNSSASITSEAICFIPFTKYFMIVIDDLNKNQTNKGLYK